MRREWDTSGRAISRRDVAAAAGARRRARTVGSRSGGRARAPRRRRRCRRPLSRGRHRQARRPRRRTPSRTGGGGVARRGGSRRQEPGRAGGVAARHGGACEWSRALERGRARLSTAAGGRATDRGHRHEREDDDDRAARRDPPCRRQAGRGRGERRPGTHRRGRNRGRRLVDRLRALELPARGRPHARLRRRRPPQPRARPPRPARELRRIPRSEAPHLRTSTRESRPAWLRDRRDRVLGRRPASRGAADPRPSQPGKRRRGNRRGPGRRRRR